MHQVPLQTCSGEYQPACATSAGMGGVAVQNGAQKHFKFHPNTPFGGFANLSSALGDSDMRGMTRIVFSAPGTTSAPPRTDFTCTAAGGGGPETFSFVTADQIIDNSGNCNYSQSFMQNPGVRYVRQPMNPGFHSEPQMTRCCKPNYSQRTPNQQSGRYVRVQGPNMRTSNVQYRNNFNQQRSKNQNQRRFISKGYSSYRPPCSETYQTDEPKASTSNTQFSKEENMSCAEENQHDRFSPGSTPVKTQLSSKRTRRSSGHSSSSEKHPPKRTATREDRKSQYERDPSLSYSDISETEETEENLRKKLLRKTFVKREPGELETDDEEDETVATPRNDIKRVVKEESGKKGGSKCPKSEPDRDDFHLEEEVAELRDKLTSLKKLLRESQDKLLETNVISTKKSLRMQEELTEMKKQAEESKKVESSLKEKLETVETELSLKKTELQRMTLLNELAKQDHAKATAELTRSYKERLSIEVEKFRALYDMEVAKMQAYYFSSTMYDDEAGVSHGTGSPDSGVNLPAATNASINETSTATGNSEASSHSHGTSPPAPANFSNFYGVPFQSYYAPQQPQGPCASTNGSMAFMGHLGAYHYNSYMPQFLFQQGGPAPAANTSCSSNQTGQSSSA